MTWQDQHRSVARCCRLCLRKYAPNLRIALNGYGGLFAEGRWHRKGQPVVYAGSSRAICLLERTVHLETGVAGADADLVSFDLVIPDNVRRDLLSPDMLESRLRTPGPGGPPDWRASNHPLCHIGSAWLQSGRSCVLVVPSAVIPDEANHLLNPNHPDLAKIIAANEASFHATAYTWDVRLAEIIDLAIATRALS
jgi:RES domain-containing protein